ncbi:12058_t:CDS:1, partial [Entrophospora sp. SA101]
KIGSSNPFKSSNGTSLQIETLPTFTELPTGDILISEGVWQPEHVHYILIQKMASSTLFDPIDGHGSYKYAYFESV